MAVRAEDTSLAHMSVSRSRRVEVEEEGHTLGLAAPSPRLAARARADCIDAATLFPSPIPASIVVPPPDLSFAKASGSKSELLLTQTLGITTLAVVENSTSEIQSSPQRFKTKRLMKSLACCSFVFPLMESFMDPLTSTITTISRVDPSCRGFPSSMLTISRPRNVFPNLSLPTCPNASSKWEVWEHVKKFSFIEPQYVTSLGDNADGCSQSPAKVRVVLAAP